MLVRKGGYKRDEAFAWCWPRAPPRAKRLEPIWIARWAAEEINRPVPASVVR
jgi:hypothetical protein